MSQSLRISFDSFSQTTTSTGQLARTHSLVQLENGLDVLGVTSIVVVAVVG